MDANMHTPDAGIHKISALAGCQIFCGVSSITMAIAQQLRSFPPMTRYSSLRLIIDAPTGYALAALRQPPEETTIVFSWNACPEYWDDLWDAQPHILVVNDVLSLEQTLTLAVTGQQGRFCPADKALLSPAERSVLHWLAQGYDNRKIAQILELECQSVRNTLTTLYRKLNIRSRTEALQYYWGIWPMMRMVRSPHVATWDDESVI